MAPSSLAVALLVLLAAAARAGRIDARWTRNDGRAAARSKARCHERACRHVSAHHSNSHAPKVTPAGVTSRSPSNRQPVQRDDSSPRSPPRSRRRSRTADHGTRLRPRSQCRTVRRQTPSALAQAGWLRPRLSRSSRKPSNGSSQARGRRPAFGVRPMHNVYYVKCWGLAHTTSQMVIDGDFPRTSQAGRV